MKEILLKVIKCLLPLFGIAAIDSCDMKVEYGCPYADFEARGVVTDEDGNGIQGIRVVISAGYPDTAYEGETITDTLWTNHSGEYVRGNSQFAYMNSVKLEFEDVDGQENGGEFQKISIEVPVFMAKEGDGNWYDGAYEAGANVTMTKK
mgnify:CR=1 FL=1